MPAHPASASATRANPIVFMAIAYSSALVITTIQKRLARVHQNHGIDIAVEGSSPTYRVTLGNGNNTRKQLPENSGET